jgi:hypothetical protein
MKLRIKGNSLRLRVMRSEFDLLMRTGRIEETIRFGMRANCRLTYALELSQSAARLTLHCALSEISVLLPHATQPHGQAEIRSASTSRRISGRMASSR